jgi:hypothetical protein
MIAGSVCVKVSPEAVWEMTAPPKSKANPA